MIPCRRLDGDLISNCTTAYCWCDGEGGGGDCGAQAGSTAQLNDRKLRVRCEGEHASSVDAQPQVRHSRTLTDSRVEQSTSTSCLQ